MDSTQSPPLKGIKVLELEGLAPGPMCGMILADYGADVIKVDSQKDKQIEYNDPLTKGKRSIYLNMKDEAGKDIIRRILKNSDILLDPYRPGVLEALGIGPEILLKINPRLIIARLTGFGQTGALKNEAGHDLNYISITGVLDLFRKGENDEPSFPSNFLGDFVAGSFFYVTQIMTALIKRESTGLGGVLDCNISDNLAYMSTFLYRNLLNNKNNTAFNSYLRGIHPQNRIQTISENKHVVHSLPISSATSSTGSSAVSNLKPLPVLTIDELPDNPFYINRVAVKNKATGSIRLEPSPRLASLPSQEHLVTPIPGQHTVEVLKEIGYSDAEIQVLTKDKKILSKL